MFKIGLVKLGNIATSTVIDLALDEIAERSDIEFKIISFGPKMTRKEGEASEELKAWAPELVVVCSPNAATPGPTAAREKFKGLPTIVISDGPARRRPAMPWRRRALAISSCPWTRSSEPSASSSTRQRWPSSTPTRLRFWLPAEP